jgi:hypothetical protein
MEKYDDSYTTRARKDRQCLGLEDFRTISSPSLEALIVKLYPAWGEISDERRIYAHVEWLAVHMAGFNDDERQLAWFMRQWRDALVSFGYKIDTMATVFRRRHKDLAQRFPERIPELGRARRAMQTALEMAVPPPSPSASVSSLAALPLSSPDKAKSPVKSKAPVIIVISDDDDSDHAEGREGATRPAGNNWGGIPLEVGGHRERREPRKRSASSYVCKRCSIPGKTTLHTLGTCLIFIF